MSKSKVQLSKAELAALDALIAAYSDDESIQSYRPEDAAFITAIARVTAKAVKVTVKATPVVAQVATAVAGGAASNIEGLQKMVDSDGHLDLDTLLELKKNSY